MLHIIKVGAEVDVNDSRLLLDNRLGYPVHRLMRCPFRTISIRPRLEIGFEDRLQNELECSLNHAVADSRNRKNADFLAPVLGNLLFPCPHGPIRVVDQFIPYLLQKTLHSAFLDGLKRDSVNPGCPVVTSCHLIGFLNRFPLADMNVQVPETPSWLRLCVSGTCTFMSA